MNADLRIHYFQYQENIHPWIQDELLTPYWRFYWNPEPGGCLRVNGERFALEREFFYVIPGYFRFSTFAERPFSQFYIHFNPNDRLPRWREIVRIPAAPEIVADIRRFRECGNGEESAQYRALLAGAILCGALLKVDRSHFRLPPRPDERIRALTTEIERDRGRNRSNDELARQCGMSRNGFIRLFHAEIGESPQEFCRRKRIELACELLHFSDCSIEEVAEQSGFADRYHFTRVFSRVIRSSPAEFRRTAKRSRIQN